MPARAGDVILRLNGVSKLDTAHAMTPVLLHILSICRPKRLARGQMAVQPTRLSEIDS